MCVCVCVCVCTHMHSVVSDSLWPHGLTGSSVHCISQARILEWAAISSSRDLSDLVMEPISPALAGGFFTTASPEKPHIVCYNCSTLQLKRKLLFSIIAVEYKNEWEQLCSIKAWFIKTGSGRDFCLWAIACYPCPTEPQSRGVINTNSSQWDDVLKRVYKGLCRQNI